MEWYYLGWSELRYRYRNVDLLWGNKGGGTIDNMEGVPKKRMQLEKERRKSWLHGKEQEGLLYPRKVNEVCTNPSLSHHPSEQSGPCSLNATTTDRIRTGVSEPTVLI